MAFRFADCPFVAPLGDTVKQRAKETIIGFVEKQRLLHLLDRMTRPARHPPEAVAGN